MSASPPHILARQRALNSLARIHPDVMADLYAAERIRLGLPGEANKGRHGTRSKYCHGCRCARCRDAYRRFVKVRVATGLADDDPRHGTWVGYSTYGCRCYACCWAASEYRRKRREAGKGRAA